jgi:hypothetical protein
VHAIMGGVPAAAALLLIAIDLTRRFVEWATRA